MQRKQQYPHPAQSIRFTNIQKGRSLSWRFVHAADSSITGTLDFLCQNFNWRNSRAFLLTVFSAFPVPDTAAGRSQSGGSRDFTKTLAFNFLAFSNLNLSDQFWVSSISNTRIETKFHMSMAYFAILHPSWPVRIRVEFVRASAANIPILQKLSLTFLMRKCRCLIQLCPDILGNIAGKAVYLLQGLAAQNQTRLFLM